METFWIVTARGGGVWEGGHGWYLVGGKSADAAKVSYNSQNIAHSKEFSGPKLQ